MMPAIVVAVLYRYRFGLDQTPSVRLALQ